MKIATSIVGALSLAIGCVGQNPPNRQAGAYLATAYNYDIDSSFYGAFGPYTFTRSTCTNAVSLGTRALDPFNVNASVTVTDSNPANTETVAFVSQTLNGGLCILQLAVTHPHTSYHLTSGTFGLQEAINDATANGGGNIVVDSRWRGTTGMITGAAGNTQVSVTDNRTGTATYTWNGSNYALTASGGAAPGLAAQQAIYAANGSTVSGQSKPIVDIRDIPGVDCTGVSDSGPALNTWVSSGGWKANGAPVKLIIPGSCGSSATLINLATTWLIKNTQGLSIECQSGDGPLNPGFAWFGVNGGTMVDAEYNYGLHIEGCSFYGQGASTFAGVGINIDKTGAGGTVNTTDNTISHNWFAGGAPAFNSYTAIAISLVSGANVEDMTINDNTIGCTQSGSPSATVGIHLGGSANAKNERFIHNEIHNCAIGVEQDGGQMDLEWSELGNNAVDIQIAGWADPNEVIANNLSESEGATQKFLVASQGGSGGQPLNFYGNNIPVNTVCAIDLKNSVVAASAFNTFYPSNTWTTAGSEWCNSTDGGFMGTMLGSNLSNNGTLVPSIIALAPLAYDPTTHLHNTFLEGSTATTLGPNLWISTTPHMLLQSTGASFLERAIFYGQGATTETFEGLTTANSNTQNATPCLTNSWCGPLEGGFEITGVATPDGLFVSNANLGAGSTHYDFYVSAVDAAGNETLLRGQNPFIGTTGSTPLSGGNFIIIGGLGSPGAASCNIYAVNPSNALQINQILTGVSCASAWTQNITSYPGTWPITTLQSPFNKTLAFLFRGKEIDFQYGTPLKGFTDQGSTATWSIDNNGLHSRSFTFATLPSAPANGTLVYCSDCKNLTDDSATFDATASGSGHGTNVLRENGAWRVH